MPMNVADLIWAFGKERCCCHACDVLDYNTLLFK
jgi:hypothetical protein